MVSLLENPNAAGKGFAVSQFPNPALREWAANPLSPGMRETFFGPLIEEVENKIKKQQGGLWDRDLFENHLMGYTIRTERYRLVAWLDYRDTEKEPVFLSYMIILMIRTKRKILPENFLPSYRDY